jgi:AcrR family transcriptional regulator
LTKTDIIEAAFRVWGRDLYRKTSLSQLAGELGVSKPALYRHFVSKQALITAMTERFLDDFAAFIRKDFEQALKAQDADDGIFAIIGSIVGFFAHNVYALIFSLVNIYKRNLADELVIVEQLKSRGVDMGTLKKVINRKYTGDSTVVRMTFMTLIFMMSRFHKKNNYTENPPSSEEITNITAVICKTIKHGLGYSEEKLSLDFDKMEKQVNEMTLNLEPENAVEWAQAKEGSRSALFFKAVAEAVAEAGPWEVSMDMVAKKLGLSKSSLYGHFKNKKDLLRRLFIEEFKQIIAFARQGINLSDNTAEQLYLGIFSISIYLRSRPEILVTMDWIRTRKLDVGKPVKDQEFFRLFEDVDIEPVRNATEEEKQCTSHWILFLLINILMHSAEGAEESGGDNVIRLLYRFISLGLGGFIL